MIRFGTYTVYNGFIFRLINEDDHFKLIYNGENCPFSNFTKYAEGIYYLIVQQKDVTNSFFVKTKCRYNGYEFDVDAINNNIVRIVTDSKEAFETLSLEFRDRGVYQTEVNKNELEKIWEIRQNSFNGLPMPEGLKGYEEIEIPKS